jgi:hypothetical protein
MKKLIIGAVLIASLVAMFPREASAAGPFNFYVRSGVLTDKNFSFDPFLWTIGANLDLNLGPILMISPECDVIVYKFSFNPVWLAPAVTVNFRASGFYAGGGIGKFLLIGSGYTLSSDLLLKLNAGFKTDSFKLQAYLWTPFSDEAFSDIVFGLTIGFGF